MSDSDSFRSLDPLIPPAHPVRVLRARIDFSAVRAPVEGRMSLRGGRPRLDPETAFRMLVLGRVFDISSDRRLCDEVQVNVAFRWFVGLPLAAAVPDHSTLSRFRRRLGRELCEGLVTSLVRQAEDDVRA